MVFNFNILIFYVIFRCIFTHDIISMTHDRLLDYLQIIFTYFIDILKVYINCYYNLQNVMSNNNLEYPEVHNTENY